jgi:5-methylcytosine-specific restriction endonuclease McrA
MHQKEIRIKSRELRTQGLSYIEIADLLDIPESTIRSWVSDIVLNSKNSPKKVIVRTKSIKRQEMGEEGWLQYQKERRRLNQEKSYQKRKIQIKIQNVNYKNNLKKQFIAYKGGKCENCGYSKNCPTVYHFHHTDPSQKEFGISQAKRKYKEELVWTELDKCQLLCSNCHGEIHDALYHKQREETVSRLKLLLTPYE